MFWLGTVRHKNVELKESKPGEVGDFFALVSMKSLNSCQSEVLVTLVSIFFTNNHTFSSIFT
jgi:hypothetical protein